MTVRAIDISRYQPSLWQGWFDELAADGVRLAIIAGYSGGPGGIGPSTVAKAQRAMAENAGMAVWGYTLPPYRVSEALACLGAGSVEGDIPALALDVESNSAGLKAAVTRADVAAVEGTGRRPLVYTSRAMWFTAQGGDADYSDLPLWDAFYLRQDYNAPYRSAVWAEAEARGLQYGFTPYSGWTRRTALQFGGNITKSGQGLDLDLVDEDFFNEVNEMISAEDGAALDVARRFFAAFPGVAPEDLARQMVTLSDSEKAALYAEIAQPDDDEPDGPPPADVAAVLKRVVTRQGRQSARLKALRGDLEETRGNLRKHLRGENV